MALRIAASPGDALHRIGWPPDPLRFKPGDLVGSDRQLTRTIARWAYENGDAGLAYGCSHDLRLDCWAVFEGASFSVVAPPSPIDPTDPNVIAVARQFELTISFAGRG